jgi:hypothetical protein
MNELEIDKTYLDIKFVNIINNSQIERLESFFNYVLENFSLENTYDKIFSIHEIISEIFGNNIDASHFYRQVKYLINKGCYNRLLKKFKNDLINLNLEESRVDLIIDLIKNYYEKIIEIQKKEELNTNKSIVSFEVLTEMPVVNTNYKILNENGEFNKDLRKQDILLKLKIDSNFSDEETKIENNEDIIIQMDKTKLVSFYEEIEKIQEKLDLLY